MLCPALALVALFASGSIAQTTECSSERQADIFLLLDASASVGQRNFNLTLDFVQTIVKSFTIGSDNVRIGMATFARIVANQIRLDQYLNKPDLLAAVGAIRYTRGNTNTHKALKLARTEVFGELYGGRDLAPNFLVVLTDGRSSHPRQTADEASLLAQQDITVLAVGVGSNYNRSELEVIASSPDLVFDVQNFKSLNSIKDQMVTNICEGPIDGQWSVWGAWSECSSTCGGGNQIRDRTCSNPAPSNGGKDCNGFSRETQGCNQEPCIKTCKSENVTADIFFLLDASHWVTESDFDEIVDFVRSFVDSFIYSQENVRMGMFPYSGSRNALIHFKQLPSKHSLLTGMKYLEYKGGETRLDAALNLAYKIFSAHFGDRATAPNFLVVVSGGRSSNPQKTQSEVASLAKKGVTVYAIGVGDSADEAELETIASSPSRVLHARDAQALTSIKDQLVGDICKEIESV
ncbi:hypothetical protein RRG08_052837 [Elysia crispata]|uniref:VWFA domain-containing protein n=1 Tax=Elysia crispata TaxID=231223 RepID=A0AAE1A558_9GAST|nr:hypothetical protein RRG08_052837 [Elysia crispata]